MAPHSGVGLGAESGFLCLVGHGGQPALCRPVADLGPNFFSALWGLLGLHYLWAIRPVLLLFFVPAFSFGMLRLGRRQYLGLVACVMGLYGALLVGEYVLGREGFSMRHELFVFIIFGVLLTWFAFFGGYISDIRRRLRAQIEKDKLIVELQDALSKVKTLSGLLPICASCKKIRDDKGYWNQLESFIRSRSEAEFSHSICPECARLMYGDIVSYRNLE